MLPLRREPSGTVPHFPGSADRYRRPGRQGRPGIAAHWEKCEAVGLPSEFRIVSDRPVRVARMPLIDGAESYTIRAGGRSPATRRRCQPEQIGSLLLFTIQPPGTMFSATTRSLSACCRLGRTHPGHDQVAGAQGRGRRRRLQARRTDPCLDRDQRSRPPDRRGKCIRYPLARL